jgi:hypothetical protein
VDAVIIAAANAVAVNSLIVFMCSRCSPLPPTSKSPRRGHAEASTVARGESVRIRHVIVCKSMESLPKLLRRRKRVAACLRAAA